MLKISLDRLSELFALLSEQKDLYVPVEKAGQVDFKKWNAGAAVRLDQLNTVKSAKDLFFPQSENLVAFKTSGKKITIVENRDENKPFILFGVKACDAASFSILDKVFLAEPVDTFYSARRKNGTVVTLACREPEETCFCSVFGIDPAEPGGDVTVWMTDTDLFWESNTEKGETLTETLRTLLSDTNPDDENNVGIQKTEIRNVIESLPYHGLSLEGFNAETLQEKFNSPKWEELSDACLGCGTCTFVCPTCQCYDIRDYDTGHGVQRFRCWDSCMFSDFTKMAHGNPRLTQKEKFRQRFMHKLIYFPANNNGAYSCVGCGRCMAKCPVSMNIVKVMKSLGGN